MPPRPYHLVGADNTPHAGPRKLNVFLYGPSRASPSMGPTEVITTGRGLRRGSSLLSIYSPPLHLLPLSGLEKEEGDKEEEEM